MHHMHAMHLQRVSAQPIVLHWGDPSADAEGSVAAGLEDFTVEDVAAVEPAGSARAVIMRTKNVLEALRSFQRQDVDMLAEVTRAVRVPGTFFMPEQFTLAVAMAAQHGVRSVDWLWVCCSAADEAARTAQFSGVEEHNMPCMYL